MKHLIQKRLTGTLFIIIIMSSVYCQVYNFLIKPGTKEWKELTKMGENPIIEMNVQ